MGGDGPFGQGSGSKLLPLLPLVSVENFHALRRRQTADHRDDPKET
jgi:nitrate reductase beta subunit